MAGKFAGKYSFVSQENFDEYLKDTGKIADSKNISSYSITAGLESLGQDLAFL